MDAELFAETLSANVAIDIRNISCTNRIYYNLGLGLLFRLLQSQWVNSVNVSNKSFPGRNADTV